jgi:tryptophan 2,3-dioxygenase
MYCDSPTTPRCTQFVETVKRNDMVLIDKQKQTELSMIFNTITTPRNSLDQETQHKYYKALARTFDARVKEWKDFAMVASFTPEGYAQFQKKIIIYAYLHHITQEKIVNIK